MSLVDESDKKVLEALEMFTINDDDVMNVKDLIHFFDSGLDFTLNNNQIKNVLKAMDENGNGKIHYGEFYLLVLFVTCDKNRDGFITYDEAKYIAGREYKVCALLRAFLSKFPFYYESVAYVLTS